MASDFPSSEISLRTFRRRCTQRSGTREIGNRSKGQASSSLVDHLSHPDLPNPSIRVFPLIFPRVPTKIMLHDCRLVGVGIFINDKSTTATTQCAKWRLRYSEAQQLDSLSYRRRGGRSTVRWLVGDGCTAVPMTVVACLIAGQCHRHA